jgi:hypothetical protein
MKLVFDVVTGQTKYGPDEPLPSSAQTITRLRKSKPYHIPGYRTDASDRGAMIAAFSRHFPGLSVKELGKLFDRYRLTGRIDVQWNAETGEYDILFGSGANNA